MKEYLLFSKITHVHKAVFWGLLFFVFSLSITGLLVFFVSDLQYQQTLSSSAYTAGTTNITDMNHYISTFGFYTPTATYSISGSDFTRLKAMVPYASVAADNFNASFGTTVEPELIVWWSYAEGIGGRISFSNCNDTVYSISNCYYPASWQLGYGIQFSAIGLLEKAFSDMHGNPNDASLVQRVGQGVLDVDRANNTQPACGGYSCTFPTMTVAQIMSGVSTSHETTNNWWASVLSRDPEINAYIDAEALQVKRFNKQLAWGWGSYYRDNWQEYSNYLQTILVNWQSLGGCSASTNCFKPSPTPTSAPLGWFVFTPTATPTPTPSPKPPSPTMIVRHILVPTSSVTRVPTPTAKPTEEPVPTVSPTSATTVSPTQEVATPSAMIADNLSPSPEETLTPTVTSTPLPQYPAVTITPAPIAGITIVPIPTISPASQVLVADQRVNRTLGTLSVLGLFIVLLLAIPITRKKIIFLIRKPFVKNEEDEVYLAQGDENTTNS